MISLWADCYTYNWLLLTGLQYITLNLYIKLYNFSMMYEFEYTLPPSLQLILNKL